MLKRKRDRFVLGITGNIGSGKSTVARLFKTRDSFLIDADLYARSLLEKDRRIRQRLSVAFGQAIFKKNGAVDRKKLGEIVFKDRVGLLRLNAILHPELIRLIKRRIEKTPKKIVILDAALIIEAGLKGIVDKLVVVLAPEKKSIERKAKNGRFSKREVALRMKSQISQDKKKCFADFIIDNSSNLSKTRKQVSEIRRKLWKS